MLFLTRWFGVTGSDAERSLAEQSVRRMLPPNNTGRSAVVLTRRVSAPEANSKSLTLPSGGTVRWRCASQRGFSRRLAYIPQLCGLRTPIRK